MIVQKNGKTVTGSFRVIASTNVSKEAQVFNSLLDFFAQATPRLREKKDGK